ncbi:MAG TPA: C10 family peptidase, partial [Paludibacter sp.]
MKKNYLISPRIFNSRLLIPTHLFRYIITCLLLLQITICFGKQITSEQSLVIAQKFYQKHKSASPAAKIKSTVSPVFKLDYIARDKSNMSKVKAQTADTTGYFYVYNIGSNQGFIIVSGDDTTKPILAYSDDSTFPTTNIPSNLQYWLDFYKTEIKYAQQTALSTTSVENSTLSTAGTVLVQPLLSNIKWDQTTPYNLYCPFSTTDNERALTGCVATAMAQIMKYNQWPVKGTGTYSYTDGTNGTLSADFGNTTYNWSNMPDGYGSVSTTSTQDSAVAQLMYQCGVSVSMNYSPSGSSALVSDAAIALKNYFGYDTDLNIYTREFYSSTEWKNMIKTELNASRLVMYGGTTGTFGHAFVCDGYDSNDLFHINWGWSGYYNGFFELSVLNPPPTESISSTGGFSQGQQIITGIQRPDAIANPSYLINMYSLGLTSTKSTITNIASQSFNVNFGFLNYGANDFNGKFAIGLYKDGVFQKTLSTYPSNVSLLANYGTPNFTLSGLSLSGLASGTYKIYCIYKPSTASSWTIMKGSTLLNNYLNVVVSGTAATITKPSLAPALTLSQKITLSGKA